MNETIITLIITAVLIGLTVPPYVRKMKKRERKARKKFQELKIAGLHEASTMHPHIDAMSCIGCGTCVRACPEGEVLGLIDGKATLIHGAKCIGHGMCADACPVGGIQMLMAKPGRSADLPMLSDQYETNIPGMYIAGELGGMSLIKNAITQGIKVVEFIKTQITPHSAEYDIAIVGAGPAGLAAGLTSLKNKLRYLILEQGDIGGTILQYPRNKIVMTSPVELPMWGKIKFTNVSKETLLETWNQILTKTNLRINTGEKTEAIRKEDGIFTITTPRGSYTAHSVVLAMGRRGTPRKLNVPGEHLSKVTYRLIDAASYQNSRILVVGGGDSAIEAAVGLANQKNNTVTLSYRRGEFSRIKDRNQQHVEDFRARKKIDVVFNSEVKEISEKSISLATEAETRDLENDFVFIFAGGELPNEFLKKVGIEMHTQKIQ
ncbi:MAG TPA: NAD(P)-binding domain-containing protein [Bacteroidota bacterium]|nr:NAD(P)-binding domain-containing protein [Bacteroidota bacterium]